MKTLPALSGLVICIAGSMTHASAADLDLKSTNADFWRAVELKDSSAQEKAIESHVAAMEKLVATLPDPKTSTERKLASLAHAQLGRAYGQMALHRGGKGKVKLGKRIRVEADRALALDADNALAHGVLGKWHYELASLSGIERFFGRLMFGEIPDGSYETAAQELRRSVELDGGEAYHRLALSEALLKLDRKEDAVAQLKALVALKPRTRADEGYITRGREMLEDSRG